ncbi:MAG: amidohydrolase [Chloroflexi bacterium]|nr:amidohydrolase [Chloroflexota bacterium]
MIIDIFTHMASAAYIEELAAMGGREVKRSVERVYSLARETPYALDIGKRVELLDTYGIDRQVVTLFGMVDSNVVVDDAQQKVKVARAINDSMARLTEESRGRLVGAGSVPLEALDHGGLAEMDRAARTLGLRAFAFPSHLRGKPLDSPEFLPFWARAAELGTVVYIHPVNPVSYSGRPYEQAYDLAHVFGWPFETALSLSRLVFSGIMEKYPGLKVVSHHLGGGLIPFMSGRIDESYPPETQKEDLGRPLPGNVFDRFRRFYYDTAVGGSAAAIKCAYEVLGADQLVFATDFPHGPGGGLKRLETYPKLIASLDIPDADKKRILGENAKRILGLD